MKHNISGISLLALSLALTACGGSSSGSNNGADNNGNSSDGNGNNSEAPQQLTVSAGDDQTVMEQVEVNLAGTSSIGGATFSWQQTAGSQVTLSDASAATPTFTAPPTTENETLTFTITATFEDQQVTDEVIINVTNTIEAPAKPKAYMAMSGEVTVEWPATAEATSYNLYYAETNPGGIAIGAAGVTEMQNVTSPITLQGLTNGQDYSFAINAVDASDNASDLSTADEERPLAQPESIMCHGDYNQEYNIDTVAGSGIGSFAGMNGPATSAVISGPEGVVVDKKGNLYISLAGHKRVVKVDLDTNIIEAVGSSFVALSGITADANNDLFVTLNAFTSNRVAKLNATTGNASVIAGLGSQGSTGDNGPAISAMLSDPKGLAFDTDGNLYVADKNNHVIRKIDTSGVITTVAGVLGTSGSTPPNLIKPLNIRVVDGQMYIADESYRLKKVDLSTGNMSVIAGTGVMGYSGDGGPATAAQIGLIGDLMLDSTGNIILADTSTYVVRLIEGDTGNIKTIAGNNTFGYSGDGGPATSASFYNILGIACYKGNIYLGNYASHRVRALIPAP